MHKLTPDTVLQRADHVHSSQVGDQTVMMDADAGTYFGLNRVASRVWALLETPRSIADLTRQLLAAYDVEPEEAAEATLAFAEDLLRRGLVVPAPPGAG